MRYMLIVAAAGLLAAAPKTPVAPAKAEPQKAPGGDVLVVNSAGLSKLLVDKKDAGLLEALRLVDERVLDLPAELEQPFPAPAIRLALDLLAGPLVLQAGMNPNAAEGGLPFYAQIAFSGRTADEATEAARNISGALQMMTGMPGQAVPGRAGVNSLALPNGMTVYHGTERAGEFAVGVNALRAAATRPASGLPKGVEPVLTLRLDAAAAQPLVEMILAQVGPDAEDVRNQLLLYNLIGPDASSFTAAVGHGADRCHAWWKYSNYGRIAQRSPIVAREPLVEKDMAMIPEDAVWATVARMRISRILDTFRQTLGPEAVEAGLQEATAELGFNPERDLLAHLGSAYGFYTSESNGGGLHSAVLFMEVSNPAALDATLARIHQQVNGLAREHAKGYVRLRTTARSGVQVTTLTFPGLPVPLEPSWAVAKGWLIVGATPQGLAAALDRAAAGGKSLVDNKRFREMGGDGWRKATSVSFMDTPRLARGGYGLTSMLCSALSNAVNSPASPDRFQGTILPPLAQLLDGAKASVSLYGFEGEDLVGTSQCDRSMLVNIAGATGLLGECVPVTAPLLAGVMLPAMAKAQQSARSTKSAAQARTMMTAVFMYATDHDGAAPPGFEAMMEAQYFGPDLLASPLGPVSDGRGDYWMNTRLDFDSAWPDRQVVIYDRAMYERDATVAVGFLDGHVETIAVGAFKAIINAEPNAGTDFDLP